MRRIVSQQRSVMPYRAHLTESREPSASNVTDFVQRTGSLLAGHGRLVRALQFANIQIAQPAEPRRRPASLPPPSRRSHEGLNPCQGTV